MEKIDYLYYFKFLATMLLLSPLEYIFWRLVFSTLHSLLIVAGINIIMLILGSMILNYLENGHCFKLIKKL